MMLTNAPWHKIRHRLPQEQGYRGRPYAQTPPYDRSDPLDGLYRGLVATFTGRIWQVAYRLQALSALGGAGVLAAICASLYIRLPVDIPPDSFFVLPNGLEVRICQRHEYP